MSETKVIALATKENQDKIYKAINSIITKMEEDKKKGDNDPLEELILTGAFTAEPTISNINWIWGSDKIGKVMKLMFSAQEDKNLFEGKTTLDSIFRDKNARQKVIFTPPVIDTAMRSAGVKYLFLKNDDVVVDMLRDKHACSYILEDITATNKIINSPESFNKFWSAYKEDKNIRDNILNAKESYFRDKMNKNQDVLTYLMNYESGQNYLAYSQIFSDYEAVKSLITAEKLQYNYMELTSLLNEPKNLLHICNLGVAHKYMEAQDERMTDIVVGKVFMDKVLASSVAMDKVLASSVAMDKVANSSVAMDKVLASSVAMDKVANSSVALKKVANSSVAMNKISKSSKTKKYTTSKQITGKFIIVEYSKENYISDLRFADGESLENNYYKELAGRGAFLNKYPKAITNLRVDSDDDDWVIVYQI